ncbi:MAG: homocysteine S-methyltransferase family protein [Lachnospiraceae bacterium]
MKNTKTEKFLHKLKKDFLVLDGGMGTQLQASGMEVGGIPELLNLTNPDLITRIHAGYVAAGADVVYANTFGANRKKMARTGESVETLIQAAIVNAKKSGANFVALDIGPIGALLEPLGDLSFEEAYDIFAEEVKAGENADIIVIETMTDLYETKAAVLAAKENSHKPVIVTMSFEANGRTFTGTSAESMAVTLAGLGVDAIGLNCSLGPDALAPIVKKLSEACTLPLVFKPNAGLPDPLTGKYDVTPEQFGDSIRKLLPLGIKMVGGCCGTTPDYIMQVALAVDDFRKEIAEKGENAVFVERQEPETAVCSASKTVYLDMPRVIGERINPTGKKRFQEALKNNEMDYVLNQAISQVEAGADILDINVGVPGIDEKEVMVQVVKAVQSVVDVPLQIDSSNPEVIAAALRIYNGKPIVNSVNGDESSMKAILPLVAKYGAAVVGLTLDHTGIQKTSNARYAIAERIYRRAVKEGVHPKNVFIDCLTMTASTEQEAVMATLEAMQRVRRELGVKTVLGVSNISFGLPFREQVTTTFLTMALCYGLTLPIVNPNVESIMGAVRSFRLLTNKDKNSVEYIQAYADYVPEAKRIKTISVIEGASRENGNGAVGAGTLSSGTTGTAMEKSDAKVYVKKASEAFGTEGETLFHAVVKGLKDEGVSLTKICLEKGEALSIVNEVLIPALDYVGKKFEEGTLFLPQLILSASVVQGASECIKESLAKNNKETASLGKVVLATVKGDIHDIGKNIVKVLLENYGFTVIDLGKDVAPEVVVKAVLENDVKLVGLSALMTTTLGSMKETIKQLKAAGADCSVVVGGAVLTEDYAREIGAEFYAKDALETCNIARKVYEVQ